MIRYQLKCDCGALFEGWFPSSEAYEGQEAAGALECPECGEAAVSRAIMAPAVRTGAAQADIRKAIETAARRAREYIDKTFEHVGARLPEEARRIHYGEAAARPIWGEASAAEVKSLSDEGIAVAPLHPLLAPKRDVN